MVTQFCLFPEVEKVFGEDVVKELEEINCDYRKRDNTVKASATAYVIIDKKYRKTYVGHSIEADKRIANHLAGKTNGSFKQIAKTRPDDLAELCRFNFIDPAYSHSSNSIARWVESFLIAYYDSIDNGYNTQYNYDHDFNDVEFWSEILPEVVLDMYYDSDHDQLNKNVEKHISQFRQVYRKSKDPVECAANDLLRNRLAYFHKMPIKYTSLIIMSGIVDVSNVYKFSKGNDGSVGIDKLVALIDYFEETLGITEKFNLHAELTKILFS